MEEVGGVKRGLRGVLSVTLALGMAAAVAACGASSRGTYSTGTASSTASAPHRIKVAMVTDVGGLGDKSFNDLGYAGLQRAHARLGVPIKVLESREVTDYETNLTALAAAGYDPIFAVGFLMTDAVTKEATGFPKTKFGGIDETFASPPPNVVGLDFKEQEGAYLAGIVAALSTQAKFDPRLNPQNVIGFVGGMEIPPVQRYQAGFIAGAKSVDPTVTVISLYADNFDDQAKGRELGLSLVSSGADVIFAAAGQTGLGTYRACADSNKALFIGVDSDQFLTIPRSGDVILTSAVKRVDNAVFLAVQQAVAGTLAGGQDVSYGLKDDAVGIAPFHDFDSKVPETVKAAVAKATAAIKAGTVTVPTTPP